MDFKSIGMNVSFRSLKKANSVGESMHRLRSHIGDNLIGYIVLATMLAILAASPAYAVAAVTPIPNAIPTNGATDLNICTAAGGPDTITSITVTDPSGTIWTYTGTPPDPAPACNADFTSSFAPAFGGTSPNWSSSDGDAAQSDESGTYSVMVDYIESGTTTRANGHFDASASFTVPEFALPVIVPAAAAFAILAFRRLRQRR